MKAILLLTLSTLFLVPLLSGCSRPEEDGTGPPPEPPVAFEGKVQPNLVGNWKTPDGKSEMLLKADGSGSVRTIGPNRPGVKPGPTDTPAKWLAGDGTLLISMGGPDGQPQVLRYFVALKGETLEVRGRKESKTVLRYERKKG